MSAADQCPNSLPYRNPPLPVERRVTDLLGRMTVEERVAQLQRILWEELDWFILSHLMKG